MEGISFIPRIIKAQEACGPFESRAFLCGAPHAARFNWLQAGQEM
jgi:hypothetical protein